MFYIFFLLTLRSFKEEMKDLSLDAQELMLKCQAGAKKKKKKWVDRQNLLKESK